MTAITPVIMKKLFELTALFYEAGVQSRPLIALNKWALAEMAPIGEVGAPPAPAIADLPIGNKPDFTEAVESALKSSPKGITTSDLRAVLAHLNEPASNIACALGRLKRGGRAEKRGDLWFAIAAPAAKANGGKIDRTIGGRRNQRQAAGAATGAAVGEEAGQQQSATAG